MGKITVNTEALGNNIDFKHYNDWSNNQNSEPVNIFEDFGVTTEVDLPTRKHLNQLARRYLNGDCDDEDVLKFLSNSGCSRKDFNDALKNVLNENGIKAGNVVSRFNETFGDIKKSVLEPLTKENLKYFTKPYEGTKYSQLDPEWSSISLGGSDTTIGKSGCFITSIAHILNRSGAKLSEKLVEQGITEITPLTVNENCVFVDGNFSRKSTINIAPNFKYEGSKDIGGLSEESVVEMINNLSSNEYVIFKTTLPNGRPHFVALDYVDQETGKIHVIDTSGDRNILYSDGYTVVSQFNTWKNENQ